MTKDLPRAKLATNGTDAGVRLNFWCPGCDDAHTITVRSPNGWGWNEDLVRPTFTPSVKVGGVQWEPASGFHKPNHAVAPGQPKVCHSFVTDGRIQFLGDSTHGLAGQTVDLPPWPYS